VANRHPATSEVEYSADLSYDRTTRARPPFVRRHELTLIDLRLETSYNVRVRSIEKRRPANSGLTATASSAV
jgi:hypothetical protein